MQSLRQSFLSYKSYLENGNFLELIQTFYADDIVQVENSDEPITGKATLLSNEENNLARVTSCYVEISSYALDEATGIAMGEMFIRIASKKFGPQKLEEAFVQKWKNGKICYQRFYYRRIEKAF